MKNTPEKNKQKDGHHNNHSETCGCIEGKTAKNGIPNIEMEEPEEAFIF